MGKCDRAKGCELRIGNGELIKASLFRFALAFLRLQKCGCSFPPGTGDTSPETLITCVRRRSESFLHIPFFKLLQLTIFSMPRRHVFWGACSEPHQCYGEIVKQKQLIPLGTLFFCRSGCQK